MGQEKKNKVKGTEKDSNNQEKKERNKIIEKNRSLLARNIACLRELYGEGRDDLAEAIGLSVSAISNYENDIRPPQRDELFMIAEHYNVSIDDLLNYDFSNDFIEIDTLLNDTSNRELMYSTLLPIILIDETVENANFNEALDLHRKIFYEICKSDDGIDFAKANIDRCTRLYTKAADEGIIEARANLLWWPMLCSITLAFFNKRIDNIQALKSKDATIEDMLRTTYLRNYHDLNDDFEDDVHDIIYDQYLGIIIENIAFLKNSDNALLRDVGDYYMAIAYKYNVISNGRVPKNRNRLMGEEMLRMFSFMGNYFAKDYFSVFRNRDNP